MKYARQTLIIFGIYLIGEGISQWSKIPIPGSLIGMILLFGLLCGRIIKVEQIAETSDFLLGHMPFFFIPAGVALMTSFSLIADTWLSILLVTLLSTIVIMGVSGATVQRMMEHKENHHE